MIWLKYSSSCAAVFHGFISYLLPLGGALNPPVGNKFGRHLMKHWRFLIRPDWRSFTAQRWSWRCGGARFSQRHFHFISERNPFAGRISLSPRIFGKNKQIQRPSPPTPPKKSFRLERHLVDDCHSIIIDSGSRPLMAILANRCPSERRIRSSQEGAVC